MASSKMRLDVALYIVGIVAIAGILIWYGSLANADGPAFSFTYKTSDGSDDLTATSTNGSLKSFVPGTTATTTMLTVYTGQSEITALDVQFAGPAGVQVQLSCQF